MPLLHSRWDLPWIDRMFCSDASESGWGVCSRSVDAARARECGKWSERWRFDRLEPHEWKPRLRVQSGFVPTLPEEGNDLIGPDYQWKVRQGFPEIPEDLIESSQWGVEGYGPFRHAKPITVLEGRAFVKSLQIAAQDLALHDSKVLFLLDNFGTTCAIEKGRATCHALLQCCRKSCALQLASGIVVRVRWVPSESNPSDKPSRVHHDGVSAPASSLGWRTRLRHAFNGRLGNFRLSPLNPSEELVNNGAMFAHCCNSYPHIDMCIDVNFYQNSQRGTTHFEQPHISLENENTSTTLHNSHYFGYGVVNSSLLRVPTKYHSNGEHQEQPTVHVCTSIVGVVLHAQHLPSPERGCKLKIMI
eukprot:98435-Amphidinium_carterae.1